MFLCPYFKLKVRTHIFLKTAAVVELELLTRFFVKPCPLFSIPNFFRQGSRDVPFTIWKGLMEF